MTEGLINTKKWFWSHRVTIERATEKLIVPALDALKDTDVLVIVTTSGNNTAELRQRFPQKNLIIDYSTPFSGRDA